MRNHGMVWGLLFLLCVMCTIAAAQSAPPRKAPPRKDILAIAKAANGSVVLIVMSDKDGKPIAQGSGFVVSKDGLIVTNYHVISEGSSAVVKLPDGAFYMVDGVLASDKERDIAVIKAHGQNFRVLPLGNSNRVQVGEEVIAIGSPLSLESTVSNGIVSAIREVKEEGGKFLQITAPISHGSSGGPLFNMAGEVIGITRGGIRAGENLNFAIPINDAKGLLFAHSSRLRDFHHEPELARTDTPPATAREEPQPPSIAGSYYRQLFDTGAFFVYRIDPPPRPGPEDDSYACFSDDPNSGTFFTFVTIERNLVAHVYNKGVKVATDTFEPGSAQKATTGLIEDGTSLELHDNLITKLTIEPTTMRYLLRYQRRGHRDVSEAGVCEKMTADGYHICFRAHPKNTAEPVEACKDKR